MEVSGAAIVELFATLGISVAVVMGLAKVAPTLGMIDHPGGRKVHASPIPLVGGISIFLTLLAMSALTGVMLEASWLLFALSLVIAIGLWDDVAEIRPRLKFAIQIVACGVMIFGAGIELRTVGDLLGWRPGRIPSCESDAGTGTARRASYQRI
jgi:UDP-GlcNAc:undecaprenyl-phosphate GlcNAc-1-phosphate transferase